MLRYETIVDTSMIRDDDRRVHRLEQFWRQIDREHIALQMPRMQPRYQRIVIDDTRQLGMQKPNDTESGRFPHVIDIGLVRNADQQNTGFSQWFSLQVETVADSTHDVRGKGAVDLSGQLDKSSLKVVLASFPTQIE